METLRRNRAPTTSQNTMLSSRPAQGKIILLLICNLDTACRHVAYHQKHFAFRQLVWLVLKRLRWN